MKNKTQPAKKSYFFGKGYKDMLAAIKQLWVLNALTAQRYNMRFKIYGFLSIRGCFWFFCALAVVIFGTIFFLVFSLVFITFLLIFFLLIYLGFSVVWLIDRGYLYKNKIFTACHECKEKSLIPTYICPSCGAKHTNLTPGVYGILKRRCVCGEKLPTTCLNGRNQLKAVCAHCQNTLYDRESRPICIPIVGGRSVGKTAFITAFSHDFIEHVAPEKGWDIKLYNADKESIYQEIKQDYAVGGTRMTDRTQDILKTSSVSFSFFIHSRNFNPDRLVHVYDIAGEVFTDSDENEIQKQYDYCQGIVLIVDPFSIDSVRYKYEKELAPEDIAGIGKADIGGIMDTFINKLRIVTGLSDRMMMRVPLAVVISKSDSGPLDAEFSKSRIEEIVNSASKEPILFQDAMDHLCRNFFIENGMQSFLNIVDMKFKNNRFFACSAIGHKRDSGKYSPKGVLEPMEWLFQHADSKMKKYWNDTMFSRYPKKVFENREVK
jgi:GTPase SAR1 family protein